MEVTSGNEVGKFLSDKPLVHTVTKNALRPPSDSELACVEAGTATASNSVAGAFTYTCITLHIPIRSCTPSLFELTINSLLTFRRLMSTIVDVPHR